MQTTIQFKLIAHGLDLYYAWLKHFDGVQNVEVIDGDILKQSGDAIVSPANSFGYMDGGLDLKYSLHFGWHLEKAVRKELEQHYFGEIPVGKALIDETQHSQIPYLVSAPTMRVPSNVSDTVNAYLAFKAIIEAVLNFNQTNGHPVKSVLCPGLATGEGKMSAKHCAHQMRTAYDVCFAGQAPKEGGLAGAVRQHMGLLVSLVKSSHYY